VDMADAKHASSDDPGERLVNLLCKKVKRSMRPAKKNPTPTTTPYPTLSADTQVAAVGIFRQEIKQAAHEARV
jgi:hypothetical protein